MSVRKPLIGILLIATRRYKQFIQTLLDQLSENFLVGHVKKIFLFIDEPMVLDAHDADLNQISIPPYKWPFPTLYRYKIFSENSHHLESCTHLVYLDIDMAIVGKVGDEILGEGLTVVRHPGFYALPGWGSQNVHPESKAFIPKEGWLKYFAGGFNAGRSDVFLKMAKELAENIKDDESRGIIAEHNDESHLNWFCYKYPEIERIELTPSYCMPELPEHKEAWGLGNLPSIIIALEKNHAEMRS